MDGAVDFASRTRGAERHWSDGAPAPDTGGHGDRPAGRAAGRFRPQVRTTRTVARERPRGARPDAEARPCSLGTRRVRPGTLLDWLTAGLRSPAVAGSGDNDVVRFARARRGRGAARDPAAVVARNPASRPIRIALAVIEAAAGSRGPASGGAVLVPTTAWSTSRRPTRCGLAARAAAAARCWRSPPRPTRRSRSPACAPGASWSRCARPPVHRRRGRRPAALRRRGPGDRQAGPPGPRAGPPRCAQRVSPAAGPTTRSSCDVRRQPPLRPGLRRGGGARGAAARDP
jgi:hypothetical protein